MNGKSYSNDSLSICLDMTKVRQTLKEIIADSARSHSLARIFMCKVQSLNYTKIKDQFNENYFGSINY